MSWLKYSPHYLSYLSFLFVALVVFFIPHSAWAVVDSGSFYCSAGHAVGTLYDDSAGSCPDTMKFSNVFSFLICHTEQLSANLMGNMFCGVVDGLHKAVTAMVTLAVFFAGVGFTLGFAHVTAKDFLALLLKIAVVYAFATEADLLIGIGYNLFITGLRDGTAVALQALFTGDPDAAPSAGTSYEVYGLMDAFLGQALHFATDAVGQSWDKAVDSTNNPCQNAIFAVMAVMLVAFPPIFYIGLIVIVRISIAFLRAIFGYMYSIVGITFLLTLSPFFLSFLLFKQTQGFFDKWLGYLVSFSLQMVIVFAFLAFVLSIKMDHITGSLTDVIMPAAQTKESTGFRNPLKYCTLCEFDVVDKDSGAVMADNDPNFLKQGKLQCRTPKKPIDIDQALTPPAAAAGGGGAAPATTPFANTLMKFAMSGLLSLLVLVYIIDTLLSNIPSLAQILANQLGGATYAPQLGGGATFGQSGTIGIPGEGVLNTLERGFTDGYNSASTTPGAILAGFKKAAERLVVGGGRRGDAGYGTEDPGLVGNFMQFLVNPQRDPNVR